MTIFSLVLPLDSQAEAEGKEEEKGRKEVKRRRVGWSQSEKRVMDAVEYYLENCAQGKVDIEVVESLLRPENLDVSP